MGQILCLPPPPFHCLVSEESCTEPVLFAGSLFRLRFFSVAESTLGTLFSYGFCMTHGLLYTLVAFLPQEGGGLVLFIWRLWSVTVGNTWQEWESRVYSQGVERDEHSTDTQPVPLCSLCYSSLVCLAKPPWRHRQRCVPWWFQRSLAGSEDGPPVWNSLCGR